MATPAKKRTYSITAFFSPAGGATKSPNPASSASKIKTSTPSEKSEDKKAKKVAKKASKSAKIDDEEGRKLPSPSEQVKKQKKDNGKEISSLDFFAGADSSKSKTDQAKEEESQKKEKKEQKKTKKASERPETKNPKSPGLMDGDDESSASEQSDNSESGYEPESDQESSSDSSADDSSESSDDSPVKRKRKKPAAKRPNNKARRIAADSDEEQEESKEKPKAAKQSQDSQSPKQQSQDTLAALDLLGFDPNRKHKTEEDGIEPLRKPKSQSAKRALARLQSGEATKEMSVVAGITSEVDYKEVPWLDPAKIRDQKGRRPDDPEYDARTLLVPEQYYSKMTPAQEQYWRIKSENFDVILFFKVGKFYELFDNDAEVGARDLALNFMKGARPHVGFPEASYGKYADQLVQMGYKVARVEQTETPKELEERNEELKRQALKAGKKAPKKIKAVKREVCSILTPGTLVEEEVLGGPDSAFLLSFCEVDGSDDTTPPAASTSSASSATSSCFSPVTQYGVCFVDTSTGTFHIGQFEDDKQRSRLRMLLAQLQPEELVFPRDRLREATLAAVKREVSAQTVRSPLSAGKEYWDASRTSEEITKAKYFQNRKVAEQEQQAQSDETGCWPLAIRDAHKTQPMAMSALGGCIWYLRRLLLDQDIVSLGNFRSYAAASAAEQREQQQMLPFLVLDGQTLENLEILRNSEGGTDGTLLKHLDQALTAFGKRHLREWVARPLARVKDIKDRLDAVEFFMQDEELRKTLRNHLRKLPDLERMLARVHAHGVKKAQRAVMYGDQDKKKLELFLKTLKGFRECMQLRAVLVDDGQAASLPPLLKRLVQNANGDLPDVSDLLKKFDQAFDANEAKTQGFIKPRPGFDPELDEAQDKVKDLEDELNQYLKKMQKELGDSKMKFVHRGQETYQMEIRTECLKKGGVPEDFIICGQTKQVQRFSSEFLRTRVPVLEKAKDAVEEMLKDLTRRMFARFSAHHGEWLKVVKGVADIDCLLSMSLVSAFQSGESCRPELLSEQEAGGGPLLELRGAWHPVVAGLAAAAKDGTGASRFIPNDTVLGASENKARFVLVSGPNMGGKSTLLRQTCLAVIMAQLGCYVPASSCRLTPVDRIFTRVGANDRIMQGQSTFLVELEETGCILRAATRRSLVILDELGRGTSTFDGTAIAYAVIKFLAKHTGCLTLFSTHYHMLMQEFAHDPSIAMYHMACVVKQNSQDVTFLYKFSQGSCPKSHGMNVAKLAGLPQAVVDKAQQMSAIFEERLAAAHNKSSSAPKSSVLLQKLASFLKDNANPSQDMQTLRDLQAMCS